MVIIILKELGLIIMINLTNFYLGMSIFKSYSHPNENNKLFLVLSKFLFRHVDI